MTESVNLTHGSGTLAARLHRTQGEPKALAVIAHGLYSSMASEKLTRLGAALAGAECAVLQYDAMGCGDTPGDVRGTTLTGRCAELLSAARYLAEQWPDAPLVYLGSSLGGTAALLAANQQPPAALVCWSTPTDLAALYAKLSSQPEPPELPALADDIKRHDLASIVGRASRVLFVHGAEDEVVPVEQAQRGFDLAQAPKDLLVLEHGDHRLSDIELQRQATDHTLAWIKRVISEQG